jgi:hypothetical protein
MARRFTKERRRGAGFVGGGVSQASLKVPLDAHKVGAAIVGGLRGDLADGVAAIGVTGEGVEPLG